MLIEIEAVPANESDSGIGAVSFGDPVRDLNRQSQDVHDKITEGSNRCP